MNYVGLISATLKGTETAILSSTGSNEYLAFNGERLRKGGNHAAGIAELRFLKARDSLLARLEAHAERYCLDDPNDEPAHVFLERIKSEQAKAENSKRKTRKT